MAGGVLVTAASGFTLATVEGAGGSGTALSGYSAAVTAATVSDESCQALWLPKPPPSSTPTPTPTPTHTATHTPTPTPTPTTTTPTPTPHSHHPLAFFLQQLRRDAHPVEEPGSRHDTGQDEDAHPIAHGNAHAHANGIGA